MFDSLANPNNQNQSAVDDIFAETDNNAASKVAAPTPAPTTPGAAINVQRVGLNAEDASSEEPNKSSFGWGFKIAVIVIVLAILGLGGYLVYDKFFKTAPAEINIAELNEQTNPPSETPPVIQPTTDNNVVNPDDAFVSPSSDLPGEENPTSTTPVNDGEVNPLATSSPDNNFTPAVDSDGDGLSDDEEKVLGLNISIIDTDNDGLSDYEEVKIYKTNPLLSDTDGDSYSDGAEVKGGYNPNGAGKLSDAPMAAPVAAPVNP